MFHKKNINLFLDDYVTSLFKALGTISKKGLISASNLIEKTISANRNIYVCGNGGSGAIADHYVVDFTKQLSKYTNFKAKIKSFNSDNYLLSAIANDISYDEIFTYQASRHMRRGDILILLSSSGNSRNIKSVLRYCNKKK